MIYSALQSVVSDFILFLLCILLIDYCTVIRMNIHGLVHKQLLCFFFLVLYYGFGYFFMSIRVKEIIPHNESACFHLA